VDAAVDGRLIVCGRAGVVAGRCLELVVPGRAWPVPGRDCAVPGRDCAVPGRELFPTAFCCDCAVLGRLLMRTTAVFGRVDFGGDFE
jgi:hypothetical protein